MRNLAPVILDIFTYFINALCVSISHLYGCLFICANAVPSLPTLLQPTLAIPCGYPFVILSPCGYTESSSPHTELSASAWPPPHPSRALTPHVTATDL